MRQQLALAIPEYQTFNRAVGVCAMQIFIPQFVSVRHRFKEKHCHAGAM